MVDRQALTSLDRAIPIEEQIRTKLEQLKKNEKRDDSLEKEIHGLANQLQALVEQTHEEKAAAEWAKLKPKVHRAAIRYATIQPK